ncbi:hypothetical protein HS7_11510 [Sulfolobales archaeon HS-7]|nr:hypothetical protein HS7_11510 [Sulfolobales archaeon HS-7]
MIELSWEGPYFEDFNVGERVIHNPSITISAELNRIFSLLTMDFTPLYLDERFRKEVDFHGINPRYLDALTIGISVRDTSVNSLAFLGIDYSKYYELPSEGNTITVETEVVEKRESRTRGNAGVITWVHRTYDERNNLLSEMRRSNLVYKRNFSPWRKFLAGSEESVSVRYEENIQELKYEGIPVKAGYLEDFSPGQVFIHRLGRTVTYFDNLMITMLSANTSPLHFDLEYMRATSFGDLLFLGPMTLAFTCGIASPDLSMKAIGELGISSVKFTAPVFNGDTIHAVSKVLEVMALNDKTGKLKVRTAGFKNRFKVKVVEYDREILVLRRKT